jgi:hypothetical protein
VESEEILRWRLPLIHRDHWIEGSPILGSNDFEWIFLSQRSAEQVPIALTSAFQIKFT